MHSLLASHSTSKGSECRSLLDRGSPESTYDPRLKEFGIEG